MTRFFAAALLTLSLAACDTGGSDSNQAVYYVAGVRYTLNGTARATATSRIAIEYTSPTGVQRDTISGALVTWSKMFDRDALPSFHLKATNLSVRDTLKQPNFVAVTLRLDGETVASDTSSTTVEVSQ